MTIHIVERGLQVDVEISIREQQAEQLWQLYEWLVVEERTQRHMTEFDFIRSGHGQGQMGFDAASINAVVANAIALGSLIVSIAAWRSASRQACSVVLKANGVEVVIDAKVEDVQSIVAALSAANDRSQEVGVEAGGEIS